MKFELRPPLILFHDSRPGQHATLFGPHGQKFPFRNDASSFKDAHAQFTWAFEGEVADGDKVVFATTDREVIGRVEGNVIHVEIPAHGQEVVVHDVEDKPVAASHMPLPSIASILQPPYPRSRPRPVPMKRPR